ASFAFNPKFQVEITMGFVVALVVVNAEAIGNAAAAVLSCMNFLRVVFMFLKLGCWDLGFELLGSG
ncbi:MAG: hypothetical protein ACK55U_08690, partial [Bacteroidota bacterium]